ncbi:hypothetical protein BDF14DRAFT_1879612 [Spinellus fusiger]|nr:hypothetical protein BDF14DRAFT_1879612 [Spinellus fusiger]
MSTTNKEKVKTSQKFWKKFSLTKNKTADATIASPLRSSSLYSDLARANDLTAPHKDKNTNITKPSRYLFQLPKTPFVPSTSRLPLSQSASHTSLPSSHSFSKRTGAPLSVPHRQPTSLNKQPEAPIPVHGPEPTHEPRHTDEEEGEYVFIHRESSATTSQQPATDHTPTETPVQVSCTSSRDISNPEETSEPSSEQQPQLQPQLNLDTPDTSQPPLNEQKPQVQPNLHLSDVPNSPETSRHVLDLRTQNNLIPSEPANFIPSPVTPEIENEARTLTGEMLANDRRMSILQKQHQAMAKDLDFMSQTMDEMMAKNAELETQLDKEKLLSQCKDQDLEILLEKTRELSKKSRDQQDISRQSKMDLVAAQEEAARETARFELEVNKLNGELSAKEAVIESLKSQLNDVLQQVYSLTLTIKEKEAVKVLDCICKDKPTVDNSPSAADNNSSTTNHHHLNPLPTNNNSMPTNNNSMPTHHHTLSTATIHRNKSTPHFTRKKPSEESLPHSLKEDTHSNLDSELARLLKEKEQLQSAYSKIPLTNFSHQVRKTVEELEARMDTVDSQLSKVRLHLRRV